MNRVPWNDPGRTGRDVYDVGEDVKRLARMLDALGGEAMTVEAVDGYLTALALLREKFPVSEWMAQVSGVHGHPVAVSMATGSPAGMAGYARQGRQVRMAGLSECAGTRREPRGCAPVDVRGEGQRRARAG